MKRVLESISHRAGCGNSRAGRAARGIAALAVLFVLAATPAFADGGPGRSDMCDRDENAPPSAAYPFHDKYVTIDGYKIHYVEKGRGRPILFVHGNPTWSYIWRNIFPCVAKYTMRRAIAVDLLGLGMSDKPRIEYTAQLHERILTKFIKKLDLKDLVIVGQDWGGPLMTHFAVHHPWRMEGLILLETFAWKLSYADLGYFAPYMQFARSPEGQHLMINEERWFVENFIKLGVINKDHFTDEVFNRYLNVLPTPESRVAMARFPQLVPIVDDPHTLQSSLDFFTAMERGLHQLRDKHMLIVKAEPGNLISEDSRARVDAFVAALPQTDVRSMGPGVHPVQEDNPDRITYVISQWLWEKGLAGRKGWHHQ